MSYHPDEDPTLYTLPRRRPDPHLPVLVKDLMTAHPVTVEPTATVKDVAEIMLTRDVHSVPVVDVGDVFIGMVSESDLICREGCPTPRRHHLSDFVDSIMVEHRHHWQERAKGLAAALEGVVRQVPGVIEVINKVRADQPGYRPAFSRPPVSS